MVLCNLYSITKNFIFRPRGCWCRPWWSRPTGRRSGSDHRGGRLKPINVDFGRLIKSMEMRLKIFESCQREEIIKNYDPVYVINSNFWIIEKLSTNQHHLFLLLQFICILRAIFFCQLPSVKSTHLFGKYRKDAHKILVKFTVYSYSVSLPKVFLKQCAITLWMTHSNIKR
jgi:hypothetical protein